MPALATAVMATNGAMNGTIGWLAITHHAAIEMGERRLTDCALLTRSLANH